MVCKCLLTPALRDLATWKLGTKWEYLQRIQHIIVLAPCWASTAGNRDQAVLRVYFYLLPSGITPGGIVGSYGYKGLNVGRPSVLSLRSKRDQFHQTAADCGHLIQSSDSEIRFNSTLLS